MVGTDESICRAAMKTQTLRTDLRTQPGGEEGEGWRCEERNVETYITKCKIESQREFAV